MSDLKRYHNLQIRFPADTVGPGATISFQGRKLMLGNIMVQTLARKELPIAVVKNGYTMQFELLCDGQRVGAAWFYFYTALERKCWGILDEMELNEAGGAA